MKSIDEINSYIQEIRDSGQSVKQVSDGHHSFGEYIDMRNRLFIALCNAYPNLSWKSKQHFQEEKDPMFPGDFIAGIHTPDGVITFHLKMEYWDMLKVEELRRAPMYDGYTAEDVKERMKSLKKEKRPI